MRAIIVGVVSAIALMPFAARAQALEETYGTLCANGKQSETCSALRKALADKASSPSAVASSTTGSHAQTKLPQERDWGILATLGGTAWASADWGPTVVRDVQTFDWVEDGSAILWSSSTQQSTAIIRRGQKPGELIGSYRSKPLNVDSMAYRIAQDGTITSSWYGFDDMMMRHQFAARPNQRYSFRINVDINKARPETFPASLEMTEYVPVPASELAALQSQQGALWGKYVADARAAIAEEYKAAARRRAEQRRAFLQGALQVGMAVATGVAEAAASEVPHRAVGGVHSAQAATANAAVGQMSQRATSPAGEIAPNEVSAKPSGGNAIYRGFLGSDCEHARRVAVNTGSFVEAATEVQRSGACIVQGWWTANKSAAPSQ